MNWCIYLQDMVLIDADLGYHIGHRGNQGSEFVSV